MNLLINRARKRGEHFELHPLDPRYVNTGSKPKLIVALLPMVVLFLLFNIWKLNINICLLCSIALSIALFWPQRAIRISRPCSTAAQWTPCP